MPPPELVQESLSEAAAHLCNQEAAIEALVDIAKEACSAQDFFQRALPVVAAKLRAVYIALEVRNGATSLREVWNHPSSDQFLWSKKADVLLTDTMSEGRVQARLFGGRSLNVRVAFLCAPVGIQWRGGGALVAVVPYRSTREVDRALALLDILTVLASSLVDSVGKIAQNDGQNSAAMSDEGVNRIQKVAEFTSETELAFTITNKLRTRDGSDQVILSTVNGNSVRVLAISGTDSIPPRTPGSKLIRACVEECADLRKLIVDQRESLDDETDIIRGARLHRRWRESTGGGCVSSIPLFVDTKVIAVLSVRRGSSKPFKAKDLEELRSLVEPYATGLEMVRFARRTLFQHLVTSSRNTVIGVLGPGNWGRKAMAVALAGLCAWALLGKIPYSVRAPGELVPVSSRQLAVASDGVLMEVLVRPGDRVEDGDLLCRFDTSASELEKTRLESELAILVVDRFRAMNDGSATDVEVANAHSRAVQANLALVEHRIRKASVFATVNGIILKGDHRSRIGDAFAKGETLYEIAMDQGWKLELQVDEGDIGQLLSGLTGQFASHSRPEESHALVITSIAPSAEQIKGRNSFTIEASCAVPASWARTGMEGFASIDAGERTPAWVTFHSVIDFARLHFWL